VARIRTRDRVSLENSRPELVIVNQSGKTAVANALQPAVPVGKRQPDLDLDVRISGRVRVCD
jgi:hypothetical protein